MTVRKGNPAALSETSPPELPGQTELADHLEELADPFDPAALRISGDAEISTERVLTAVPVRKPKRDEFFRVHAGGDYTMDAYVVEREDDLDRQVYVVVPSCAEAVSEMVRRVRLFTCISKRGTVFLWPAKLPGESGSGQRWAESVHSRGLRPEIVRPRAAWRAAWPVAASHAPGADSPPARPGWRAARLVARVCRPGRW